MENEVKTDLQEAMELCRTSFATAGFFSLFINFLMLVPALYMLQLYDRVLVSSSEATLVMLTLIMVLLFITMGSLTWARSAILVRVSARLETLLKVRLFGLAFKQALYSPGVGSASQPLDDLTGLRQFLTGQGLFAFFDAPWMPIYIAVMFMFHEWFGWMAIATVIVLVILAYVQEKQTGATLKLANSLAIDGRGLVNRNLRNAEVVESMGMLAGVRKSWVENTSKVMALQCGASNKSATIQALTKTIRLLSQSLVLGVGAYLVLLQEISPGLMIAGSILLGRALAPIDLMIGSWKGFISARGQYNRLNENLLAIPQESKKMELPSPDGELIATEIMVGAAGGAKPILIGVSLSLAPGESLGIIGPSASGKSTLARALLGIWPVLSGSVRLDGVDIFNWNKEELGPYIGYLPQDIELFEGSISDNISRFGGVEPEKVVAAARIADVHDMILKLPKGYDTVIGSVSGVLSGGQRQRIGLARAVYDDPKLVLLDEPNSNLDEKGESALEHALAILREKKTTVIVITHRPGILKVLDKLLLLKNGRLVHYGTTKEVLEQLNKTKHPKQKGKEVVSAPITIVPVT